MAKGRKLFLSTLLGVTCLTAGCVNKTKPIEENNNNNNSGNNEEIDEDVDYEYEFPYYISNSKILETEDEEVGSFKKHLYVRAWDNKNPTQKDGYYGLQRAGEYAYNNFAEAFNPDTKMFSYEPINESTAALCKTAWKAELDDFFKNNEDDDINYVVLSCNGDINANLHIFNDYNESGSYKHYVGLSDIINWFNNYKGKFYIILASGYGGRWIRSDYVASYGFLNKLNKEKYTIISESTNANSYRAYSYKSTSDTTISLPSDLASQISVGLTKDKNNNFIADFDGDGNLTVDELYTYGRTAHGTKGTFCEIFSQNREEDVLLSNYKLDLYSLTSGSFVEEGKERLTVEIPSNKTIKSIGMPNIKEGYKFTGWSFDREGNEKVTFPLKITANTQLFANYESKKGANPGYISAQQYDVIRIPYKDSSYNDFYILDFKTNENEPGMFLLSTGLAGMARYPMESETKYYWDGTYAQYWCHEYANRFFTESLDNLIIPCDAPLGTDHPEIHMENEKLFFLSRAELEKYLTPDILRLDEDYYLRHDSSSNNLHLKSSNSTVTNISKTLNNTKGTRPAMNLNISKSDLEYDKETGTFFIKSVGKYVKTTPKRYDGTYTVKVDGEVTYTASGNRKLACDNMNSLASSRWETKKPWVYNDGYDTFLFKPGKYRGTLYNTNLRDFYDYEHIENCFVGTQVHGLDCAASVSAAYTLTFGKKFINNLDVAEGKEYLYGCMQYAADAIDPGIGDLPDYLKNKTSGTVTHHDLVHIPGNPTTPTMPNNETALFGHALDEALKAKGTNIFEAVYQYILPGDGIVARGVGADKTSTSHTRMIIGVDIVHDGNKIDSAKSKIYYADTSTPKSGRFIFGGESTSYCNFDTYSSKKTNSVTFDDLLSIGYLPFSLNNWETGYEPEQIGHWVE